MANLAPLAKPSYLCAVSHLAQRIPLPVHRVCNQLQQAGYQAYVVGGAVRDLLHFQESAAAIADFDVASSATPEQAMQVFGKHRTLPTGLQHGTVTVMQDNFSIEVTTFRGESDYQDGRRPKEVFFLQDITQDLQRRDFTINAMAYNPHTDQLIDPFGGQKDLAARLIRAVGEPLLRFQEDGLRPLRAARFVSQLHFRLDEATQAAILPCLPVFRKVSWERIYAEMMKLLGGIAPAEGLGVLQQTGLFVEIFPEYKPHLALLGAQSASLSRLPNDPGLRLAGLLGPLHNPPPNPAVTQVLHRLKTSKEVYTRIWNVLTTPLLQGTTTWTDIDLRQFLSKTPEPLRTDLLLLQKAKLLPARADFHELEVLQNRIQQELAHHPALSIQELALSGTEVMQILQIPAGKQVGQVLRWLLAQVLKDPKKNTKRLLRNELRRNDPKALL